MKNMGFAEKATAVHVIHSTARIHELSETEADPLVETTRKFRSNILVNVPRVCFIRVKSKARNSTEASASKQKKVI